MYTPMRPHRPPTRVAATRPRTKNSYWKGSNMLFLPGPGNLHRRSLFAVAPAVAIEVVRTLGNQHHPLIFQHWHFGAVSQPEVLRGNYLPRRPFCQDMAAEAHQPGQVYCHGVDFMSSHDDGDALVVKLMQQMHYFVP